MSYQNVWLTTIDTAAFGVWDDFDPTPLPFPTLVFKAYQMGRDCYIQIQNTAGTPLTNGRWSITPSPISPSNVQFPPWLLNAYEITVESQSQCQGSVHSPSPGTLTFNFGTVGDEPSSNPDAEELVVTVTASGTPWSTPTTMNVTFRRIGKVGWITIPFVGKPADTTTPHISFVFPGGQWPPNFRPAANQAFNFKGVYSEDVLWEVKRVLYISTATPTVPAGYAGNPGYPDQAPSERITIDLERTPEQSFNLLRIVAPCYFAGSGPTAQYPWPAAWVVEWPAQTFCYLIDEDL